MAPYVGQVVTVLVTPSLFQEPNHEEILTDPYSLLRQPVNTALVRKRPIQSGKTPASVGRFEPVEQLKHAPRQSRRFADSTAIRFECADQLVFGTEAPNAAVQSRLQLVAQPVAGLKQPHAAFHSGRQLIVLKSIRRPGV